MLKGPRIATTILKKKKNVRRHIHPNFKTCYKIIVCYCYRDRHIDKWNRILSLEMNPCIYRQLIFDKRTKKIQQSKNSIFYK